MIYEIWCSDAVVEYISSQDKQRRKLILKYLHNMKQHPLRNAKKLSTPLQRYYRTRIGDDRILFSIRDRNIVYLELMGNRNKIYEIAKRLLS
jgi:mRNA-degrading endonuclease RelE of RelBE toxin-antitoxin system